MARPRKDNADYFSHDSEMRNDTRIKAVRRKYGMDGYGVWNMILEVLTRADFFTIHFNEIDIELLSGDFDMEPERLKEIVSYFVQLGLLQSENGKIWSNRHKQRFIPLLSKRKRDRTEVSDSENPKSKGKDSKEDNSKGKETPSDSIDFEKFKSAYPDVNELDSRISRKWYELDRADQEKILADIPKRLKAYGKMMPGAFNYLMYGKWNDTIKEKKSFGNETSQFASKPKPFDR